MWLSQVGFSLNRVSPMLQLRVDHAALTEYTCLLLFIVAEAVISMSFLRFNDYGRDCSHNLSENGLYTQYDEVPLVQFCQSGLHPFQHSFLCLFQASF